MIMDSTNCRMRPCIRVALRFRRVLVALLVAAASLALIAPEHAFAEKKYHIKNDFMLSPTVGAYYVVHDDVDAVVTYGVRGAYFFNEHWAAELELLGHHFYMNSDISDDVTNFLANQRAELEEAGEDTSHLFLPSRREETSGFGFMVGPRYNFFPSEVGSLYISTGVGGVFTEHPVPYEAGESLFAFKTELGQDLAITDHISFMIRLAYRHMGPMDEDGLDALGGSFGMGYTF